MTETVIVDPFVIIEANLDDLRDEFRQDWHLFEVDDEKKIFNDSRLFSLFSKPLFDVVAYPDSESDSEEGDSWDSDSWEDVFEAKEEEIVSRALEKIGHMGNRLRKPRGGGSMFSQKHVRHVTGNLARQGGFR